MGIHASLIRKTAKLKVTSGELDVDLTQTWNFSDLQGTLGADLDSGGNTITNLPTPSASGDAAPKSYVDSEIATVTAMLNKLAWKDNVQYATTANLSATYDNGTSGVGATLTGSSNGAISVDSASPSSGDRILVKNQSTATQNGIYTVTTVGSAGAAFVLTRTTDADSVIDLTSAIVQVDLGTTNADTTWYTPTTISAIGTTEITFSAFGGSYTAGNGIDITSGTISAKVDDSTTAFDGSGNIIIKDNGVTAAKLSWIPMSETFDASSFTYSGVSGLSVMGMSASLYTSGMPELAGFLQLTFDGVEATSIDGTVTAYSPSGAPDAAGEWRINGSDLEIYGDVTATGSKIRVRYVAANS